MITVQCIETLKELVKTIGTPLYLVGAIGLFLLLKAINEALGG